MALKAEHDAAKLQARSSKPLDKRRGELQRSLAIMEAKLAANRSKLEEAQQTVQRLEAFVGTQATKCELNREELRSLAASELATVGSGDPILGVRELEAKLVAVQKMLLQARRSAATTAGAGAMPCSHAEQLGAQRYDISNGSQSVLDQPDTELHPSTATASLLQSTACGLGLVGNAHDDHKVVPPDSRMLRDQTASPY